jgi:two-component system, NarL family, response regulator NreC
MKIKILIADENKLFRELLAKRFLETSEIEVVAEAENSQEVLEQVKNTQPDIILIDIGVPQLKGIETTKILRNEFPKCKVIALTSRSEKMFIKGMLEADAWGYILKNCTYDQLISSITQVFGGKKSVSTDVEGIILEDYLGRHTSKVQTLTDRETGVLKLLAEGKSIREISDAFFISIKTVGTHKQNIFEKMGFENLAQLIKYAMNNGIVS